MGVGPEITLGAGGGGTTVDTDTDEEEEPLDPISDIQQIEADPETFDRTFLATKEQFNIGGGVTNPVGFPLQAIPRMAFVINYNVVFDEDEGKWVPQNPFSAGPTVDEFVVTTVDSVGFTQLDGVDTFHIINNQSGGNTTIELPPRETGAIVVVKNSTDSGAQIGVQDADGSSTGIDDTTQATSNFDADGTAARFYADTDRSTWWVEAFASGGVS